MKKPTHGELLRELVARFNARESIEVERYFAPKFQLRQPGGRDRAGLAGAQDMIDALHALGERVHLRILAMVEQDDHLAVRWQVEGLPDGAAAAMMGIYRFEAGRIVEDWGLVAGAPWPGE
jgi:predicted SnoaL-like aldol condensation-catalyzing enzyme